MKIALPSYTDFEAPSGYVAVPAVAPTLYGWQSNPNPWGIRCGIAIERLYGPIPDFVIKSQKRDQLSFWENIEVKDQLLSRVEKGLIRGQIRSIALVADEYAFVQLPPSVWAFRQKSLSKPLEAAVSRLDLAMDDQPFVLLSYMAHPPLGIPLLSKQSLAQYLHAEREPCPPSWEALDWNEWRQHRQDIKPHSSQERGARSLKKRGRGFKFDWTPMWHELIRQGMKGNLEGWTLPVAQKWLLEWLSQQTKIDAEETTVRRLLIDLFPDEAER
jgi:hypothetical protein